MCAYRYRQENKEFYRCDVNTATEIIDKCVNFLEQNKTYQTKQLSRQTLDSPNATNSLFDLNKEYLIEFVDLDTWLDEFEAELKAKDIKNTEDTKISKQIGGYIHIKYKENKKAYMMLNQLIKTDTSRAGTKDKFLNLSCALDKQSGECTKEIEITK